MSTNTESTSNPMDIVKWVLALAIIAAAIAGNTVYGDVSVLYRAIGVVVAVAVGLGIAATTTKGQEAIAFARDSRTEVRKVVWPTRQEATQTTLIVLAATVVVGLLLWGLDGIIVRVVSFITGLGV